MDETGYVQPTKAELRKHRGVNSIYHNNGIQTWHVQDQRGGRECRGGVMPGLPMHRCPHAEAQPQAARAGGRALWQLAADVLEAAASRRSRA